MTTRPHHPLGFTLVELVLALAISIIVLGAVQSIVMVASHSVPVEGRGPYGSVRGTVAMEQLGDDLASATLVLSASERLLELQVPDRDSDGFPDGVRYAWSGTAGDPLTREYRGNALASWDRAQVVVRRVGWMQFKHECIRPVGASDTDPADTLLASFEPVSGIDNVVITSTSGAGQSFRVSLPSTATQYRITRIAVRASQTGLVDGTFDLTLSRATVGLLPDLTTISATKLRETRLAPNAQWIEVPLSDGDEQTPGSSLVFTIQRSDGDNPGLFEYGSTTSALLAGTRSTSLTGLVWLPATGAMAYRVYGYFTTANESDPKTAPRYAGCTLQFAPVGDNRSNVAELTFQAPNRPQAP